jgi:hypothetical protein
MLFWLCNKKSIRGELTSAGLVYSSPRLLSLPSWL